MEPSCAKTRTGNKAAARRVRGSMGIARRVKDRNCCDFGYKTRNEEEKEGGGHLTIKTLRGENTLNVNITPKLDPNHRR